jgi:hypothetical protein
VATAAWLGDRYISGDPVARFLGESDMRALITAAFPAATIQATELIRRSPPNYSLVVTTSPS